MISKASIDSSQFKFVLPARITGVVFFGLVLAGLIIAVFLLHGKDQEMEARYNTNAILFTDTIKNLLIDASAVKAVTEAEIKGILQHHFSRYQHRYQFNAFVLYFASGQLKFGQSKNNDLIYEQFISINNFFLLNKSLLKNKAPATRNLNNKALNNKGLEDNTVSNYRLSIYYPNLTEVVIKERKNTLLIIAVMVLLFGLMLQKTLQYILNKPFTKLLNSAQQFAQGDTTIRFDDSSSDEFGFLAKFINEALDSIAQQQSEVHRALASAKKSEKALFKEKELAEVTLHSINDAVISTNEKARINYMNPVAERMLGWSKEDARGKLVCEIFQLVDETNCKTIINPLAQLFEEKSSQRKAHDGLTALKQRDGNLISVELSVAPMRNQDNKVIGGVVVFQDVSDTRRMTTELSFQAEHDALTGLFNRRVFEERLQEMLEDVRGRQHEHVLCYLDLDQFKIVNDTCGHRAGDELLRQLSQELSNSIRESDLLARLGGDEFGILLEDCELMQAESIANTLRENVQNYRFVWDERIFEVGVSIGVVSINQNSEKFSDLLSAADLACYAAKDSGRNRIHIYQPTDEELSKRHSEMHCVTRLNNALEEDSFMIYKQPVVSLSNKQGTCMHWEILVRMRNLQNEIVSPEVFISAAERYNIMPKIDRVVLQKSFEAMAKGNFFRKGFTQRIVGINLSGDSLMDDTILAYIKEQADIYQIDFKEVCLEITETVAIANLSKATHFMKEMKQLGCQFALDDFGSGLSSFGYLKHLPVDYLKIDGSFVKDMFNDKIDRAMVESINQIGHIMGMKTIAEWVEDAPTMELLKNMGVDYSQGHFSGKPEPL